MALDREGEISETLKVLRQMKGELVWFVRLSAGHVLRMDFGTPHLKVREPSPLPPGASQAVLHALGRRIVTPAGKWHLFITEAEWSVATEFHSCNRSDTNLENINMTLRQLDGQTLTDIEYTADFDGWLLAFDLGGILRILPRAILEGDERNEVAQWTLFVKDGDHASFMNDGSLKHKGTLGD